MLTGGNILFCSFFHSSWLSASEWVAKNQADELGLPEEYQAWTPTSPPKRPFSAKLLNLKIL
jgi:hypothetical protein